MNKLSSDYTPTVLSKYQLLSCINANMVALCRDNVEDDLMDWIGYGKLIHFLLYYCYVDFFFTQLNEFAVRKILRILFHKLV